ncbi:MAG TPA: phytoene/squalene synthase family protein [Aggregatilineales bacterium]|nr:phytoene/squalene synthase family protein [Aggregatilineales bacterium]
MTLQIPVQGWESQLLAWAQEPLMTIQAPRPVHADNRALRAAYLHCEDMTRLHSKTFYLASGLLPLEKRNAVRALYAFCRVTDDLVDRPSNEGDTLEQLTRWKQIVTEGHPSASDPVALAWADAQARFHIPAGYAEQLINGVARDLQQKRYETFADLAEYSYGVASTVGLMAMHIIGFHSVEAVPYAVKLGVALQLTNILRDVHEDWKAGRLYLPQDELRAFEVTEEDIANQTCDDRWKAFMNFQVQRNRQLYDESRAGIALLRTDGRFAIAAAADLYRGILDNIEQHDGNIYNRRASVSTVGKLRRLPLIWWRAQTPNAR